MKREISNVAEIGWDGFSPAVGRLIYRKIAEYCENSSELRKAYPEIAQRLEDHAYIQRLYAQAEKGVAAAQNDLGYCYLYGNHVEQDDEQAVKWFRKAAERGLPEAQYSLGTRYYNGDGVEQDLEQAVKWLREAAKRGYPDAQRVLALRFGE